jgi:hypothetical protein
VTGFDARLMGDSTPAQSGGDHPPGFYTDDIWSSVPACGSAGLSRSVLLTCFSLSLPGWISGHPAAAISKYPTCRREAIWPRLKAEITCTRLLGHFELPGTISRKRADLVFQSSTTQTSSSARHRIVSRKCMFSHRNRSLWL